MVESNLGNLLEKTTEAYYLLRPLLDGPKRKVRTVDDVCVKYRRASCGDIYSNENKRELFGLYGIKAKFTEFSPIYLDMLGEIFDNFNLGDNVEFASISKEGTGPDIAKIRFDSGILVQLFNRYNGEDNINYNLTKKVEVQPLVPVITIHYRITPKGLLVYLSSVPGESQNTALLYTPRSMKPIIPLLSGVEGRGAFELELVQRGPREKYDFGSVDVEAFYSTVSENTPGLFGVNVEDVVLRLNTLDAKIQEAYRPDILDEVTKEMYG